MAELNGTNYKLQFVDDPSQKIPAGEQAGRVRMAYDEYDLSVLGVVVAATDNILMMKLPPGARVLQAELSSPNMGATGIFDLGWQANGVDAADQNGLIDQADAGGQAVSKLMSDSLNIPGNGKKFTVETQLEVTCTEVTIATTGIVKVKVYYVVE